MAPIPDHAHLNLVGATQQAQIRVGRVDEGDEFLAIRPRCLARKIAGDVLVVGKHRDPVPRPDERAPAGDPTRQDLVPRRTQLQETPAEKPESQKSGSHSAPDARDRKPQTGCTNLPVDPNPRRRHPRTNAVSHGFVDAAHKLPCGRPLWRYRNAPDD